MSIKPDNPDWNAMMSIVPQWHPNAFATDATAGAPQDQTHGHYSRLAEQLEIYRLLVPNGPMQPYNPDFPDMEENSEEYLAEPPILQCLDEKRQAGVNIYKFYNSSGPLSQDTLDELSGEKPQPRLKPRSSGSRLNDIMMATARPLSPGVGPNG